MKRIFAILLTVLLLCGMATLSASAAGAPSFKKSYYQVRYLSTTQLTYENDGDTPVRFECTENALGISVDEKGLVTSEFCLRKWGFVTVTILADDGSDEIYDTCLVEVDCDMWQWMIVILLLGWFWY